MYLVSEKVDMPFKWNIMTLLTNNDVDAIAEE